MDKISTILISNQAICFYEAVILCIVFIYWLRLRKEKKRKKEMNTLKKEKARNENLDQMLKNNLYQGDQNKILQNNIPYEIDFHEEVSLQNIDADAVKIQIVEQSRLSTRKYIIFVSGEMVIGRGRECALILNDSSIAEKQCKLFCYQKGLYLQALETGHAVKIKRKKSNMHLGQDAVNLIDGDCIELGETSLNIHFI
ncbi:MAG: FHA domain-containing protein [Bacteroidales bacterium]|nr:FHA domain-containing protein [Clostridium sp.]MCM1204254.1 FHA domain-containing protein [Bacteroidales bacterium]